jgi:triacylglycerol lipase
VARRHREQGRRRGTTARPLHACPDPPSAGGTPADEPFAELTVLDGYDERGDAGDQGRAGVVAGVTDLAASRDRREAPAPRRGGLGALATRLGRDVRAFATPTGVRGAVVESLWVTAHVATYPWGLVRERQEGERYGYQDLRPHQRGLLVRDVETAGTPILLLHGMIDNRAIFTLLTRRLRGHGFTRVRTLNYSPATNDIRAAAESLAQEVEALVAESGHERIHVVGHSLGGLIARYYVQRLGGDTRVRTLVIAAHLVPARLGRQLRPGSDLYRELDLPAPAFATRIVAYWSDLDQLIVPHDNARLDHPDLRGHNVVVRGAGHLSLPITGRVVREVTRLLAVPDDDAPPLTGYPGDAAEDVTPA